MNEELTAAIEASFNRLKSQFQDSPVFQPEGAKIKDKYHIGHRLDEGKKSLIAEIRVCTNRTTQRRFAVKSYYLGDGRESSTDIIFTKRRGLKFSMILNEIQIQLMLDHPNICKLHEVYLEQKYIHLVIDYCKGGELYDYLSSNKPMTLAEAFPYFIQLLDAVDYLRSQSVVHRSLSLENIMFYDNERTTVKIISFASAAIGERFTEKYGCALYMAPEVFNENYDSRCDIWSLGVCFYAMVIGHQPFQGKTVPDIIKKVNSMKLLKTNLWKKLPKSMKNFIKSMIQKESSRPYAEDLLDSKFIMKFSSRMAEFVLLKYLKALKDIDSGQEYLMKVQFANRVKKILVRTLESRKLIPNLNFLEEIWNKIDKQHLKVVTIQAVETYFSSLPTEYQDHFERMNEAFKHYDSSKNNTMTYLDFLSTLIRMTDKNLITLVFELLDEESNGVITASNLCKVSAETDEGSFAILFEESMGKKSISKEELISLMIKFTS